MYLLAMTCIAHFVESRGAVDCRILGVPRPVRPLLGSKCEKPSLHDQPLSTVAAAELADGAAT
jgi:hypothetical protein